MDGNNDLPPEERPNVVIDAEDCIQILHLLVLMYVGRQRIVLTHRAMRFPLLRYLTFRNFPRRGLPDIRDFVNAGFYYAGNGDTVFCHRCGFSKGNWVATDSPFEIYRRHAPLCIFYQNNNVVNFHSVFNLPRTRETARTVNRENLRGPYPESNEVSFEEQTIEQTELPIANLPGYEGGVPRRVFPETSSILQAGTNSFANDMGVHIRQIRSMYSRRSDIADPINESLFHGFSHYDHMRSVQNTDYEQGMDNEMLAVIEDSLDSNNNNTESNVAQNFNIFWTNQTDQNETARKVPVGFENETSIAHFTVPSPEDFASGNPNASLAYKYECFPHRIDQTASDSEDISTMFVDFSDDSIQRCCSSDDDNQFIKIIEDPSMVPERSAFDNHGSCAQELVQISTNSKEDDKVGNLGKGSLQTYQQSITMGSNENSDMRVARNQQILQKTTLVNDKAEINTQHSEQQLNGESNIGYSCIDEHEDVDQINHSSVSDIDDDASSNTENRPEICEHHQANDVISHEINSKESNAEISGIPFSRAIALPLEQDETPKTTLAETDSQDARESAEQRNEILASDNVFTGQPDQDEIQKKINSTSEANMTNPDSEMAVSNKDITNGEECSAADEASEIICNTNATNHEVRTTEKENISVVDTCTGNPDHLPGNFHAQQSFNKEMYRKNIPTTIAGPGSKSTNWTEPKPEVLSEKKMGETVVKIRQGNQNDTGLRFHLTHCVDNRIDRTEEDTPTSIVNEDLTKFEDMSTCSYTTDFADREPDSGQSFEMKKGMCADFIHYYLGYHILV
ncbi:uncharacterized protein LOC123555461 [Mercenaria mercenaria]|uniref:uncharacterized protein LOC123555461 n=1 Tax=Mercenaria mercenaria TaxID=6596 RepID=UPI00234E7016|nr:uncharacterized protein LOC123555461 [Mercenaria mercenaria]